MRIGHGIRMTIALLAVSALLAPLSFAKKGGGGKPGSSNPAIAFVRVSVGGHGEEGALMVMDADGTNLTLLRKEQYEFSVSGYQTLHPSWSPDSTQIAFSRIPFGWNGPERGIYRIDVDGSNLTRITDGWDETPAWSPDGTEIAYVRDGDVRIAAVDGSSDVSVAAGSGPAWSPDGTRLAYVSGYEVFVENLSTGAVTNVTAGGPLSGLALEGLDWARTEDRIAVSAGDRQAHPCASDPREVACYVRDVWLIDLADPLNPFNLTNTPQDDRGYEWGERNPTWSPDDAQVAFHRGGDVYVIDADGTGETLLARAEAGRRWLSVGYAGTDWKR